MCKAPSHYQHRIVLGTKANSYHHVMALVNILQHMPSLLSLIYNDKFLQQDVFGLLKLH